MDFFENDNTGRLLSILNDDINQLERFLDQGANQIIQLFVTVLIIGGTMIFVAPKIALFAFFPIPIIFLGSIKFQRKLAPKYRDCLLYTSPSPRDTTASRMPSSA